MFIVNKMRWRWWTVLACVAAGGVAWSLFWTHPSSQQQPCPVWVISLARHGYRRRRLSAQASGITFLDAVDGAKLHRVPKGLTAGEWGCFYSHVGVWLRLVESDVDMVLVLEDDANVRLPLQWSALMEVVRACPADWDVVYAGHNNQRGPPGVMEAKGDVWGTHAYFLTRHGARTLLDAFGRTQGRDDASGKPLPVDVWMSRQQDVKRYCAMPSLVRAFDLTDSETQRLR